MPQNTFDPLTHTYTIEGIVVPSITEICSVLTANKYSSGQGVIDAARARGAAVHELCETYDYGSLVEVPSELSGYVGAWMDFCRDYRPTWHYIEHQMFSKRLRMAGTCDRIGMIDGKMCVVDIKTTSNMDRASKIALACQLYGYGLLFADAHGFRLHGDSFGVQLKKDGTYVIHDARKISDKYSVAIDGAFLSCYNICQAVKGVPKWTT